MIRIYTIGHSTRKIEDFIKLLNNHKIKSIVDIRTIPRSAHNPQFNKDTLPAKLMVENISYLHFPKLGGLRHTNKNSVNTGWRNKSFRGFADYMQTKDFLTGLKELLVTAKRKRTCLMCAEAVPWRCHRSLIADALTIRNIKVLHIISDNPPYQHKITSFAKTTGRTVFYPS